MIIVIGGIPGTGKSTLAEALSSSLNLPLYAKDILEAAVVRRGLATSQTLSGVGYELMSTLAEQQVWFGNKVIVDFIASRQRIEAEWPSLLKAELKYIECVCSDSNLHRNRLEIRERNIEGWYELSWDNVLMIKREYQPFQEERLILDSVDDLHENIERAKKYILADVKY